MLVLASADEAAGDFGAYAELREPEAFDGRVLISEKADFFVESELTDEEVSLNAERVALIHRYQLRFL